MDTIKDLAKQVNRLMTIVARIDKRLAESAHRPEKKTWIKVSQVTRLTGWDRWQLQAARRNGLIEWKKNDNGIWYLLESIPEQLINNKRK